MLRIRNEWFILNNQLLYLLYEEIHYIIIEIIIIKLKIYLRFGFQANYACKSLFMTISVYEFRLPIVTTDCIFSLIKILIDNKTILIDFNLFLITSKSKVLRRIIFNKNTITKFQFIAYINVFFHGFKCYAWFHCLPITFPDWKMLL